MKSLVIFVGLLLSPPLVHAESRLILLEVTSLREVRPGLLGYSTPQVNVYSAEEKERRQNVSIAEAARVLKEARGMEESGDGGDHLSP